MIFTLFRKLSTIGLLICLGLLAFALYLQQVHGLKPCPLCVLQRAVFFLMAVLFLSGMLYHPLPKGRHILSGTLIVLAVLGGLIALRQVFLQMQGSAAVGNCGPGLGFMLQRFSLPKVIMYVFQGSGDCALVDWTFLGLSIAGWALLAFAGLGVLSSFMWRAKRISER